MKTVKSLKDCVSGERVAWIESRPLSPSKGTKYIDFNYLVEHADDPEDTEWFKDPRIKRWSDHVQRMTGKDLRKFRG